MSVSANDCRLWVRLRLEDRRRRRLRFGDVVGGGGDQIHGRGGHVRLDGVRQVRLGRLRGHRGGHDGRRHGGRGGGRGRGEGVLPVGRRLRLEVGRLGLASVS